MFPVIHTKYGVPLRVLKKLKCGRNNGFQFWDKIPFKPFILFKPNIISWRWMGQRHKLRQVFIIITNGFGKRSFHFILQIIFLSILPDQKGELNFFDGIEQRFVPKRSAFRPGREVTGFSLSGITKSHRDNCQVPGIIKDFIRNSHPFSEPSATGIVPWNSGFMNSCSGSLTNYSNFTGRRCGNYWTRTKREIFLAYRTSSYFLKEFLHERIYKNIQVILNVFQDLKKWLLFRLDKGFHFW